MIERLVRYADLIPCVTTLPDRNARDSEGESFTLDRSAAAGIHAMRCVGGQGQGAYAANAAEILFAHTGRWRVRFGPNGEDVGSNGEDAREDMAPGDVVSVAPRTFRRIDKVDGGVGFLLILRGSRDESPMPDPASLLQVPWVPLWAGGAGASPMLSPREPPIGRVVRDSDFKQNPASPLAGPGVEEAGIVAPQVTRDGFAAGPLEVFGLPGFNLRMLTLQSGAYIPLHTRAESEFLFAQQGSVEIRYEESAVMMGAGDTLRVPIGRAHSFRNCSSGPTRILIMRGADDPSTPVFLSMPMFVSMPPHG